MAVQELNFQGINRAITDYALTGACEELINLRPTTGGLVPVKGFTKKITGASYNAIYVHNAGALTNYIALTINTDGTIDIEQISDTGTHIADIDSIELGAVVTLDKIHYATAGNYFLISICDRGNDIYENRAFLWDGTTYVLREANVPRLTASVASSTDGPQFASYKAASYSETTDKGEVIDILNSAFNAIQEQNKTLCFGQILIAVAYKTIDGSVFWTNMWLTFDPSRLAETLVYDMFSMPFYVPASQILPEAQKTYPYGAYLVKFGLGYPDYVQLGGVEVKLTISQITGWNSDTSLLKSVEIYVSKPALYANPSLRYGETFHNPSTYSGYTLTYLPKIPYEERELDNQLLYFQKSIPLEKLLQGSETFSLQFGGVEQTVNETLQVDAGAVYRYGNMLSYNARFHYFDSVTKVGTSIPGFWPSSGTAYADTYVFVRYNNGLKDTILYVREDILPRSADIVLAATLKVKEVITIYYISGTGYILTSYPMTESQRYNYSININVKSETTYNSIPEPYATLISGSTQTYVQEDELDAINVSEQYNPFVFKVEHSYLAPGKVLDIQPQMVAVKDVTFGDYPLNVFTDRGTYALLQGNGQVLYGNFRSMSNLVSMANSVPTEHGTFFLAAGGLWAVAGSDAILISDALHLGPHKFIRDCAGYQALSASGVGYNVANYVSEVPFEEFTKCAKLSYNRFRDELIVSNNFYRYSYVLSLKYRQWFKIDECLLQDNIGVNIARRGNRAAVVTVISSLAAHSGQIVKVNYVFDVQLESSLYTRVTVTLDLLEALTVEQIQDYLVAALSNTILSGTTVTAAVDSTNMTLATEFNLPATITGNVKGHTESLRAIPPITPDSPTIVDSTSNMSVSRTTEVIDFSEETDGSVRAHLQSRPFSFSGYMYSHIHRIVSMVRTALSTSDLLIAAVYGSDDLQNWTLLSYGGRAGSEEHNPLQISQLRTPPAARSWRYYTICIGGTVPTDTDFGPVLVDYQPVIRRLG